VCVCRSFPKSGAPVDVECQSDVVGVCVGD
jgi:hypothetical protein